MIRVRAEQSAILIWNRETSGTAYISGKELNALASWAEYGKENGFVCRLKQLGIISEEIKADIFNAINEAIAKKSPFRSFCAPESLHVELTTRCPLECPQCYKGKADSHDLSFSRLITIISQAFEMKVFQIALGGGEPLIYPKLTEVIEEVKKRNMSCSITTSGLGLTSSMLTKLISVGLQHMQVSLNGSTKKTNMYSRNGFDEALGALHLLNDKHISYGINWVARMDNIDDLPEIIALAKGFGAKNINILRYKPSETENYAELRLSYDKVQFLKKIIQETKGISIKVDSAFSNLLCHMNKRTTFLGGCGAGRRFIVLDAEGNFRPCSHVSLAEEALDLQEYWRNSADLALFRCAEEKLLEPCATCCYVSSCRGCRAIAYNHKREFYAGDEECSYL